MDFCLVGAKILVVIILIMLVGCDFDAIGWIILWICVVVVAGEGCLKVAIDLIDLIVELAHMD